MFESGVISQNICGLIPFAPHVRRRWRASGVHGSGVSGVDILRFVRLRPSFADRITPHVSFLNRVLIYTRRQGC